MRSRVVKVLLYTGLASILLFALPLFPISVINSSLACAAERAEPLDINTATIDNPKPYQASVTPTPPRSSKGVRTSGRIS